MWIRTGDRDTGWSLGVAVQAVDEDDGTVGDAREMDMVRTKPERSRERGVSKRIR